MTRSLLVIGIGAGNPEQVTMQAVRAMNRADVFFVLDKGEVKAELIELREEVVRRYVTRPHRLVVGGDPPRDRRAAGYTAAVDDWRRARADVYETLLAQLAPGEVGAFLVWGDPTLYDSTLAVLGELSTRGYDLDVEVVPGISSPSALVARHATSINTVGGSVQVTTGRRLRELGWPAGVDDVVVMLDADCAFLTLDPRTEIFWGAYLGLPDEILVSGSVGDVGDRIVALRAAARERKGWIMDTYLLRRVQSE